MADRQCIVSTHPIDLAAPRGNPTKITQFKTLILMPLIMSSKVKVTDILKKIPAEA